MAKELFAGQKNNKYKIVISKEAISKKNLSPLLKQHKKTLIITDDGVPQKIVKKVNGVCKPSTKVFKFILQHGENAKSVQNFQKILNYLADNNFDRTDLIVAVGGEVVIMDYLVGLILLAKYVVFLERRVGTYMDLALLYLKFQFSNQAIQHFTINMAIFSVGFV